MRPLARHGGVLVASAWIACVAFMVVVFSGRGLCNPSAQQTGNADAYLLLAFRAFPPHERRERPLYQLAQRITGFIDGRQFPPTAVITDKDVRYNVYSVRRRIGDISAGRG